MTSRLWSLWVGGLVLGLVSPCPPPCDCPPPARSLTCRGCPSAYLAVGPDTLSLDVSGCRDILYLLRLHRPMPPDKQVGQFTLKKLQITDSFIEKIPESYVSGDYAIQTLVMSNNSIETLDSNLEAKNLTFLDLSRNQLSFLQNNTFSRMDNLVFLDLGSNRIENMSIRAFDGLDKLVHLDLSRNNLTSLMDAIFLPLVSLQRLNMSFNRLAMLSDKCFGSLLSLQQLDVSYNQLTSVAPGTLQFLPNLAKLLLADNPQLRPDAQIFVGTGRRLQQVDASRTGLKRVPEALTHSVRYLSLAGNRISTLRCGDLDGYPLLHMLDFADNIIENVEDDALGRLEMISRLYLNINKLQTVPKMLPDKLTYLSLDTNLIKNLTTLDFSTLTGLKILLLSNNLISYIQENTFVQLISLEVLDVSNNPLKILTPNTFAGPISLKDFRIAFVNVSPPAKDISFPVPSPEGIESLHLQHSPGLTRELMADTAALAAMSSLQYLDMSFSNITNLRSDLLHFLSELKILRLDGNNMNCSDLGWLGQWMRDNLVNEYKQVQCSIPPEWANKLIIDLPPPSGNIQTTNRPNTTPNFTEINKNNSLNPNCSTVDRVNIETVERNYNFSTCQIEQIKKIPADSNAVAKQLVFNRPNISETMAIQSNKNKSLKSFSKDQIYNQSQMLLTSQKYIGPQSEIFAEIKKSHGLDLNLESILERKNATGKYVLANERSNKTNKINKPIPYKKPIERLSEKSKLIEIFSQLSHVENDGSNTSKQHKTATQESASLCIETGNLNGTENKTKCSQHPEIAPVAPEKNENKNIKLGRFIYRKNGNDKSSINTKLRKSKYVSRPNERYKATDIRERKNTEANETTVRLRQLANQTRVIESLDSLQHGNLYQHNLHGPTLSDIVPKDETSDLKVTETKDHVQSQRLDYKSKEKHHDENDGLRIKRIETEGNVTHGSVESFEEPGGSNVSDRHQTSKFRAEASSSQSGLGLGALVGVCGAACAALAGACLARYRPRAHRRQGAPEMIEVQTITAVGELW